MERVSQLTATEPLAYTAAAVARPGFWRELVAVVLTFGLTATALAWIFPPHGLWPLAFVALVPWATITCRAHRAWVVHWLSFLVGWGFFLVSLRWLMPVTGLGYAALGLYLAIYWPLAAWVIRTGRRHGVSVIWTLPIAWVACEYLRAFVMTGFPWLFLAHSVYAQLPLIQISDITGAYGVSFVIALVNGLVVEALLRRFPGNSVQLSGLQLRVGAAVVFLVLGLVLGYGAARLSQVRYDAPDAPRGPRVAVVQQDFPLVSTPPYGAHPYVVLAEYLRLGAEAARERPDLLAFPETVWSAYQNIDFIERRELVPEVPPGSWDTALVAHRALSAFSSGDYAVVNEILGELERRLVKVTAMRRGEAATTLPRLPAEGGPPVTVLYGALAVEQYPEATYPKVKKFNSAFVYDADGQQRRVRYDKRHLVPFGEYVPFQQARFLGFDLHWLYRALNRLSPFSDGGRLEYSLARGLELTVFPLDTPAGTYRFGAPICYEDVTPYLIREYVWGGGARRVDFLVNISNDGWFLHSNELPQHLAICAFRAVENRVGFARAVNTGISGFIDPNGRIYSTVTSNGRAHGPGVIGVALQHVYLDDRLSVYGRLGDWFAGLCLVLACVLWAGAIFERWILAVRERVLRLVRRRAGHAAD